MTQELRSRAVEHKLSWSAPPVTVGTYFEVCHHSKGLASDVTRCHQHSNGHQSEDQSRLHKIAPLSRHSGSSLLVSDACTDGSLTSSLS